MYRKERINEFREYQVDTNGVVYSKRDFPLKFSVNPGGYAIVNFTVNGRSISRSVHSIVANQFLPVPEQTQTQVNHKDGNKLNNHISNLEWVTPKQNVDHARYVLGRNNIGAFNHKAIPVRAYDEHTGKLMMLFDSMADAGRYFAPAGKNFRQYQNSICRAANGKRKTYKGFIWECGDIAA